MLDKISEIAILIIGKNHRKESSGIYPLYKTYKQIKIDIQINIMKCFY